MKYQHAIDGAGGQCVHIISYRQLPEFGGAFAELLPEGTREVGLVIKSDFVTDFSYCFTGLIEEFSRALQPE